ncbi:MAG: hypothetical protein K0R51_456 [Cytophagaceae bacterium]|jgi:hypothetical protein|nr:hypothetical protein [Cytophagaceae bacterium]
MKQYQITRLLGILILLNNIFFVLAYFEQFDFVFQIDVEIGYIILFPFFTISMLLSLPAIQTIINKRPAFLTNGLVQIGLATLLIILSIYPALILFVFVIKLDLYLIPLLIGIPVIYFFINHRMKENLPLYDRQHFTWTYFSLNFQLITYYLIVRLVH